MSSPRRPLLLSFSSPFLVRPRRRLSSPRPQDAAAGARRVCQGGRFSAGHRQGGLYTTEHDGRLDGFGRLLSSVTYPSSCQRALFRSGNVLSVGLATKSMARAMFASTYIRQLRSGLPRCCLHGRSCRRHGLIFEMQICRRRSAMRTYSHTSNPPDTPDWGCRNSAHCQRYRVRVAPCGTRPCSR